VTEQSDITRFARVPFIRWDDVDDDDEVTEAVNQSTATVLGTPRPVVDARCSADGVLVKVATKTGSAV
jgi:hypothetical protein